MAADVQRRSPSPIANDKKHQPTKHKTFCRNALNEKYDCENVCAFETLGGARKQWEILLLAIATSELLLRWRGAHQALCPASAWLRAMRHAMVQWSGPR